MFTNNKKDYVEMLRQLRMFSFCTIDLKLEIFRSSCTLYFVLLLLSMDRVHKINFEQIAYRFQ